MAESRIHRAEPPGFVSSAGRSNCPSTLLPFRYGNESSMYAPGGCRWLSPPRKLVRSGPHAVCENPEMRPVRSLRQVIEAHRSPTPADSPLRTDLAARLVCPECHKALEHRTMDLACRRCGVTYPRRSRCSHPSAPMSRSDPTTTRVTNRASGSSRNSPARVNLGFISVRARLLATTSGRSNSKLRSVGIPTP